MYTSYSTKNNDEKTCFISNTFNSTNSDGDDLEDDCRGAVLLEQGRHAMDPVGSHGVCLILVEGMMIHPGEGVGVATYISSRTANLLIPRPHDLSSHKVVRSSVSWLRLRMMTSPRHARRSANRLG